MNGALKISFPQMVLFALCLSNASYGQATNKYRSVDILEWATKGYVQSTVINRLDLNARLAQIGWNRVLDPQRLKNDTGLSETKFMLREAKNALNAFNSKQSLRVQEIKEIIKRHPLKDSNHETIQDSLENRIRTYGFADLSKIEALTIELYGKGIHLLLTKKWEVLGSNLVFENDADADSFNNYAIRIGRSREKAALLQQSISKIRLRDGLR